MTGVIFVDWDESCKAEECIYLISLMLPKLLGRPTNPVALQ